MAAPFCALPLLKRVSLAVTTQSLTQVRLTDIRLAVGTPEAELPARMSRVLGVSTTDIASWKILRRSLDARSRFDLQFVYTLMAEVPTTDRLEKKLAGDRRIELFRPDVFADPPAGTDPLVHRPIVVGTGPAGLLAGYYLALRGYRPLILERGFPVKERVPEIRRFDSGGSHDPENNYLFGEGGAGCFSDGKLTCRMTGPDVDWVLEAFITCGGRSSIRYEFRPHLGSNKLPMICRNFRRKIDALGGEYKFGCRVEGLDFRDGTMRGLQTSSGYIPAATVILGIGHSARDTYEQLHTAGVPMVAKPFQLGLRIEQPQSAVNRHKYGKPEYEQLLGAADYTLVAKSNPDVYTFCMCAGGFVIPSVSEPGQFCTNGMSNSRHDTPFANSGLMVTLDPREFGSDHPLAGMELQRQYERRAFELGRGEYLVPLQSAQSFLANRQDSRLPVTSYERGAVSADLHAVLPPTVLAAIHRGLPLLDQRWRGDFLRDATLVGPEMRGSAPLRMLRDLDSREVPGISGLYPVGEGAGYAGGIVSAAVDGLRSAKSLVARFAPV